MKRVLPIFMAAVLLLSGCSRENPEDMETTGIVQTVPATAEPKQTRELTKYPLSRSRYTQLAFMGEKLLLMTQSGEITLFSQGKEGPSIQLGRPASFDDFTLSVAPTGLCAYDSASRQVLVYNPHLQPTGRVRIPQNAEGAPALSMDKQEIYYCQAGEIRALSMETGISRLIKTHTCRRQEITGSYFDGGVIRCAVTDLDDKTSDVYLETATGRTVSQEQGLYRLDTFRDRYFAWRMDGQVPQRIFGIRGPEDEPAVFTGGDPVFPVLGRHEALVPVNTDQGLMLQLFDLRSGLKSASVVLKDGVELESAVHGKDGLWVLANTQSGPAVYYWVPAPVSESEQVLYREPLYNARNVDEEGLRQCRLRADELEKKYGVKITFYQDALSHGGGHTLVPEYQVDTIMTMLHELEPALAMFPQGFLSHTVERGSVRIGLVRSISGNVSTAQFFEKGSSYILLTPESDIRSSFLFGAARSVDSHVLGNSRKYDDWEQLNPKGFAYDLSFSKNEKRQDTHLAEGKTRAFVDKISMSFPYVDRSRILCAAMEPKQQELFDSPVLQKKLETVCRAIRESYGLEKKQETYLWEQYLHTPIAYQK